MGVRRTPWTGGQHETGQKDRAAGAPRVRGPVTAIVDPGVSDAAIIEASRRETDRFGALYDRYAPMVYRYVCRRLGTDEAVEDVVADTFLAAFRRRVDYNLDRPDARPWLLGIATKEIASRRRTEEARYRALSRAMSRPEAAEAVAGFADRVTAAVSAQTTRAALAAALGGLKPADRDVVLLIAWSELSYEEVAESLGIKIGTVRSRLHRARRQLREALGATNPIHDLEDMR
jgi:RNA polymerase sigma factor (sigma-70 family)